VRLLIDSHVALWWLGDAPQLGRSARRYVTTADQVVFSAVTPWELGIKKAIGKLECPDSLVEDLTAGGFEELRVSSEHAWAAAKLDAHHRDPFDRMLIAQAQLEGLRIVTADQQFNEYDVEIVDARV
jgi:PIN domain nuclease of toxin-antitoxin system